MKKAKVSWNYSGLVKSFSFYYSNESELQQGLLKRLGNVVVNNKNKIEKDKLRFSLRRSRTIEEIKDSFEKTLVFKIEL